MVDYKTYDDIGDQIENLIDDDDTDTRTVIDQVINTVYQDLIADISRSSRNIPPWLKDLDDTVKAQGPSTITNITGADPGVITVSAAHGLTVSDIVSIYGIVGMTTLNNRAFKVNTVPLTTTLSLIDLDSNDAIDTSAMTAWASGGTVHHRGRILNVTAADVERVLSATWNGYPPMAPITEEGLEDSTIWWGSNTSQPSRYLHKKHYTGAGAENNILLWFPASNNDYDLRYWFERRVSPLSASTDVPILPPWAHMALVWGSLIQLAMFDIRVKAGPWAVLYSGIVSNLKGYSNNFVTQGQTRPFAL